MATRSYRLYYPLALQEHMPLHFPVKLSCPSYTALSLVDYKELV
jgi:hypothetical protein